MLQRPVGQRPTLGFILLLGAMTAFAAMSIDLYLPSLPTMGEALDAPPSAVQQTVSAFLVGLALGQFIHGPLSDRYGRRPPLLGGIAIYIAASLLCAVAPTVETLIAGRFLQGFGGCAALVVARAVVRDRYDLTETARIFSYLTLVLGIAPVLAPLAGSVLLMISGWRAIFVTLALFGAAVGAAALARLPETRTPAAQARARAERPFTTYATLLRQPRLVAYLLSGALAGTSLFVYVTGSATLFIEDYGLSPLAFSWLFGANAIAFVGAAQLNRAAVARRHPDRIVAASLDAAAGVAVLFAALAWAGAAGPWVAAAFLFLLMGTFGFSQPNTAAGALSVDPSRSGAIAALTGGLGFAVGAVVAALTGLMHDGTARPMATMMAVCYLGAALAFRRMPRP